MADDPLIAALDQWIARAREKQDLVLQAIAQDALARVKELTPVRTGYLRANWTVVRGSMATQITTTNDESLRDAESLKVTLTLQAGDQFSLINPVAYARRVEYGFVGTDSLGRHFDQKGAGMMTRTIAELPQIADRAVERINRMYPP